ncbi:CAP domain-containing protein [Weissella paramesenteroides]
MIQIKKWLPITIITVAISVTYQEISMTQICADNKNGYINQRFYKDNVLANGYLNDGQQWFLFKDGSKQIEIQKWQGNYYYFDPKTGLRSDNVFRNQWGNTYYFDKNGIAVSGFQLISGKKYYFGDDGTHFLRKNTWLNINGKQYYADINGVIVSGVQKIDSNYYFFNIDTNDLRKKRDYILSQWGKWYLINEQGIVQSGLQYWAGNNYYFDPVTFLKVENQTRNINNVDWYFDNQGIGHKKIDQRIVEDITFAELNKIRKMYGHHPLVWDNQLAQLAQNRASLTNKTGIPANHWRTPNEVIGIGWQKGNNVIMAWFNETNMLPKGTRGHHDWLLNNSVTKVGFGYSGNVIVGKSN